VAHGRDHAGRYADRDLDEQCVCREQHCRLNAVEERLGDRFTDEDRLAEVENQNPAKPVQELDWYRVIQPELLAEVLKRFGGSRIPQDDRCRIARGKVDQGEDDDPDHQDHRDKQDQAPQDIRRHVLPKTRA
jgi:hypothetical protein